MGTESSGAGDDAPTVLRPLSLTRAQAAVALRRSRVDLAELGDLEPRARQARLVVLRFVTQKTWTRRFLAVLCLAGPAVVDEALRVAAGVKRDAPLLLTAAQGNQLLDQLPRAGVLRLAREEAAGDLVTYVNEIVPDAHVLVGILVDALVCVDRDVRRAILAERARALERQQEMERVVRAELDGEPGQRVATVELEHGDHVVLHVRRSSLRPEGVPRLLSVLSAFVPGVEVMATSGEAPPGGVRVRWRCTTCGDTWTDTAPARGRVGDTLVDTHYSGWTAEGAQACGTCSGRVLGELTEIRLKEAA